MSVSYFQDKRYCQEFTYEGLPCYQKSEYHDALCDWHRAMKARDSAKTKGKS